VPKAKYDNDLHWFALRAFQGKTFRIKEDAEKDGVQTYMAMQTIDKIEDGRLVYQTIQLVPSLIFVHATFDWIKDFKQKHFTEIMVYRDSEKKAPEPVPDKEMEMFMLVTANGARDVEFLGAPKPEYLEGDRVRVTQGIYKGSEGIIKRIRRDRKLLVAVTGVAVVAISHIPQEYLEKVEK